MEKPDIKNAKYRDHEGNFKLGLWSDDKTLYIYDLEKRLKASEAKVQRLKQRRGDLI